VLQILTVTMLLKLIVSVAKADRVLLMLFTGFPGYHLFKGTF